MFKRQWWRMSIDRKVQSFAAVIVFIILVSAGFAMFTMNYSLRDYGQLLDENRACQSFMKAMEEEGLAFDGYVSAGTETARDTLEKAIHRTERAIDALPFDYEIIGAERYTRTWNIRNAYQQYAAFRDEMLSDSMNRTGFAMDSFITLPISTTMTSIIRVKLIKINGSTRKSGSFSVYALEPASTVSCSSRREYCSR